MHVSASITIGATPQEVFDFVTEPENGPLWQEGAVSNRVISEGPVRLGTEMEHVGRWLRMRIATRAVVTLFEPPAHYGYDITSSLSASPSQMRYLIEPADGGTRLTLSNEVGLQGWMRPFEPLLRRSVQGMFERDIRRLRDRVQAGAAGAA